MSIAPSPRLRSFRDRLRQIALFEAGGLLMITPPYVWLTGQPGGESVVLMAALALLAATWNGIYNTAFDWIEGRLTGRSADLRPWSVRAFHAAGFELGILLMSLPLIVFWTDMSWTAALLADLGLAVAYVAYAFVFNLAYDKAFPIDEPLGAPR
ncbi:MAG TPA: PACE efflux transporter [Zoogloea sp.]|uniref:PACE efflux transporter n=1 Tax=Zoogloea sp. TaxID=49181 RepID=UPI001B74AC4A|nr:PACE efflux transporter [Zoogloea sp.]MBP8265657.1 PACE efflux transporter [Zoogloea sp.]HOB47245.1 PACE efflux transporter [Zoogloea sp.]HQA12015.1 PACE efflux transporter [Zoogloea sp.]HQE40988.1 PACE efflux transporter [Zoogloea sp.]